MAPRQDTGWGDLQTLADAYDPQSDAGYADDPRVVAMKRRRGWGDLADFAGPRKRGFAEVMGEMIRDPVGHLPLFGTAKRAKELFKVHAIAKRADVGTATEDELDFLIAWVEDSQRTVSGMGQVAEILKEFPRFAGEFFLGGALASLGRSGAAALVRSAAIKAVGQRARKAVARQVVRVAGKTGYRFARGASEATQRVAALHLAGQALGGSMVDELAVQAMLPDMHLSTEEAGQVALIFQGTIGEYMDALPKAALKAIIELGSEMSGAHLARLGKRAVPALAAVLGTQASLFRKIPGDTAAKIARISKKGGWNGVLEEFAEERFAGLLEAGSTEFGDLSGVFPGWDRAAIELTAFAMIGGGMRAAQYVGAKVDGASREATRQKFREELEAGLEAQEEPEGAEVEPEVKPLEEAQEEQEEAEVEAEQEIEEFEAEMDKKAEEEEKPPPEKPEGQEVEPGVDETLDKMREIDAKQKEADEELTADERSEQDFDDFAEKKLREAEEQKAEPEKKLTEAEQAREDSRKERLEKTQKRAKRKRRKPPEGRKMFGTVEDVIRALGGIDLRDLDQAVMHGEIPLASANALRDLAESVERATSDPNPEKPPRPGVSSLIKRKGKSKGGLVSVDELLYALEDEGFFPIVEVEGSEGANVRPGAQELVELLEAGGLHPDFGPALADEANRLDEERREQEMLEQAKAEGFESVEEAIEYGEEQARIAEADINPMGTMRGYDNVVTTARTAKDEGHTHIVYPGAAYAEPSDEPFFHTHRLNDDGSLELDAEEGHTHKTPPTFGQAHRAITGDALGPPEKGKMKPIVQLEAEEGLFEDELAKGKKRDVKPDSKETQQKLIDVDESDLPGQQSFLDEDDFLAFSGEVAGAPGPRTGDMRRPKKGVTKKRPEPEVEDEELTESGWTKDVRPLTKRKEGKFKRTRDDSPAAVKKRMAEARARARRVKAEIHELDNIYRIIEDVARRFGLGPPRLGRAQMLTRWAMAFFDTQSEEIRMRKGSWISSYMHEVGHAMHKIMFPRARRPEKDEKTGKITMERGSGTISAYDFPAKWRPWLTTLGKDLYGEREPNVGGYATEGWAEVFRFLFNNPQHLRRRTPQLYREVVTLLVKEHPETWLVIQEARARLLNVVRLSMVDPVDGLIDHDQRKLHYNFINLWDQMRTRLFDRMQRAHRFMVDLKLTDIPKNLSPHHLALRFSGHVSGDLKLSLIHTWDPADPEKKRTGMGLVELLRPVRHSLRQWQNYMVAKRILEKRSQGYEPVSEEPGLPQPASLTSKRLRKYIAAADKAHPEFEQAGDNFQTFNRWVIQTFAVHYDLLAGAEADLIVRLNQHYITFRHKKTESSVGSRATRESGFVNRGKGVSRFREGRGEELLPPLEAYATQLQGIFSNAHANAVARSFTDHFHKTPGIGRWFGQPEAGKEKIKVSREFISDEIEDQLGISLGKKGTLVVPRYLEDLDEDQVEQLMQALANLSDSSFWRPHGRTDRESMEIRVLVRGKPIFYEVQDPQLFALLEGLHNPYAAGALIRFLRVPGRILKGGATQYNPSFFIPNFTRDFIQSVTFTDTDMLNVPEQTRKRLEGMRAAFLGGDLYHLFLASGADMAGLFGEYYEPGKARINFEAQFGKARLLGLVHGDTRGAILKDLLKLGAIDRMNRAFEQATRLGELNMVYQAELAKKPRDEEGNIKESDRAAAIAEAGAAAADTTLDFSRGGTWSKNVNEVVPFFNAAMLGADKLAREIRKNPVKAAGRIVTFLIIPSVIQMLILGDDEDYWAMPKRLRDRHWFFPTGHTDDGRPTYLKIPKPYGLGAFSIAVERSYAAMWGINPENGKKEGDPRATEGMWLSMFQELRPTISVAGVQPIFEVMAGAGGYSFYRQQEIVSGGDLGLPLPMQGARRSSDLARFLGQMLGYPPGKIDYLVQGFFGGLGRDVVQTMIDPVIRRVDPEARLGEPLQFNDWLIVRRFVAGQTRGGHEALSRFYDDAEKLERIYRGSRALNGRKRRDFESRHRAELRLRDHYSRARRDMSDDFRKLRHLYKQPPSSNLDLRVDRVYDTIISKAQRALRRGTR